MRRRWPILTCLLLGAVCIVFWRWNLSRRDHRFDLMISQAAARHRVPAALVKAVIWQESRFEASARGGKGELGLMQITEDAAMEWAAAQKLTNFLHPHVLHPGTNLDAGCHYLGKLIRRYSSMDDPTAFALADYNAGRGNVLRWMRSFGTTNRASLLARMDFPGTREYIQRIQGRRVDYEPEFR